MKRILKYELDITETQEIEIPSHQIISVINQDEKIMVYAVVGDQEPAINHTFKIYGTGKSMPDKIGVYKFLGTVNLLEGSLIFHVFYK